MAGGRAREKTENRSVTVCEDAISRVECLKLDEYNVNNNNNNNGVRYNTSNITVRDIRKKAIFFP